VNETGGAIYCFSNSSPTLNNCILWGNSAVIAGNEIYIHDDPSNPSYATLNYCCVDDTGYGGETDNIHDDNECLLKSQGCSGPEFVDTDGPDDTVGTLDDDLHLQDGSPCIDAGNDDYIKGVHKDLDGYPRIVDGNDDGTPTVDIGAYEYRP